MLKFQAVLLEVLSGDYEGYAWAKCKARSLDVVDNTILSYKVDAKRVDVKDIKEKYLDKMVELTADVVRGKDDTAVLRVVSIRPVK